MPLLDAKCPNCGGILKVDGAKDAAICEHCGNAYVVEKAIQNYYVTNNVTNNYMGDVNVFDNKADDLYNSAKKLEDQKKYADAEEIYKKITVDYPNDYRGWWGMYRTCTFGTFYNDNPGHPNENYIDKAIILAPDDIREQIENDKKSVEERRNDYKIRKNEKYNFSLEELISFIGEGHILDLSERKKPCYHYIDSDGDGNYTYYKPIFFVKNGKLYYRYIRKKTLASDDEYLLVVNDLVGTRLDLEYLGGPDWYSPFATGVGPIVLSIYSRGTKTKCVEIQLWENKDCYIDNICEFFVKECTSERLNQLAEVPTTPPKPNFTIFDYIRACYIATAVYGSYDCPQVWTLRRFRDYSLLSSWYGRLFVRTYYAISPHIVKLFGQKKWFTASCRKILDRLVGYLKKKGYTDTPYSD